MTYTQYLNHDKFAPLVMKFTNRVEGDYRTSQVENFKVKKSFKLHKNPHFVFTVEASHGTPEANWSLMKFAFREEKDFADIISNHGADPGLIYEHERIFRTPHSTKVLETEIDGVKLTQVVISFKKQPISKPRDPNILIAILDESLGGMPVEMRQTEFGGMRSRQKIEGWHQIIGTWVYRRITSYLQRSADVEEKLHSIDRWSFSETPESETVLEPRKGIPEKEYE